MHELQTASPFTIGGPVAPTQFLGRKDELNRAFDVVVQAGHLAVYGGAGIGKSSLLRVLAHAKAWEARGLPTNRRSLVLMDAAAVRPFTGTAFWREALTRLHDARPGDTAVISAVNRELEKDTLGRMEVRNVIRTLHDRNWDWVLLVDDFDHATHTHATYDDAAALEFLYGLRSLATDVGLEARFATAVATAARLDELRPPAAHLSPWYNHTVNLRLRPYSFQDAQILTALLPLGGGPTPTAWTDVLELTGRHPALLQRTCDLLARTLARPGPFDRIAFQRELLGALESLLIRLWGATSEVERMLLMLIALEGLGGRLAGRRRYDLGDIEAVFSRHDRDLWELENQGLIERVAGPGRQQYRFASSILEWWVIQEIESLPDEAALASREQVFAQRISRRQVQKIHDVLLQVWKNKDTIRAAGEWLGKLLSGFQP